MNVSSDPTIAETLRSLAASTVRGILQTAGVQALSSEIRQQTTSRPGTPQQNTNTPQPGTASGNSSTTVELSPAAKFPPLASVTASAAAGTRPSDVVLTAALPLPATLGMLSLQVGKEQRVREVMQLAVKLGQTMADSLTPTPAAPTMSNHVTSTTATSLMAAPGFAAAQYAAMRPWKESVKPAAVRDSSLPLLSIGAPASSTSAEIQSGLSGMEKRIPGDQRADLGRVESVKAEVSPLRTDLQKLEAMYAQNGAQGYVRVDVSPLATRTPSSKIDESAFAATLQVKLPVLGDIVITLALSETRTDLAFAATPQTLELLKLTQTQFRQAAAGWGLNLKGLNFIPFVNGRSDS
jgi:hypothetical protein